MEGLFKIFKRDEHDAEKIEASTNEPHLHDFEELIIGQEEQLEHFIDFKQQTLTAPFISFVSKGKIHRVKPLTLDGKCSMWVLRFRSELIPARAGVSPLPAGHLIVVLKMNEIKMDSSGNSIMIR